jgi:hypothetical protein
MATGGKAQLGIDFYLIGGVSCRELKLASEEMGNRVYVSEMGEEIVDETLAGGQFSPPIYF